ncbi:MAG: hypothetical protein VKN83_03015 [Cyanobacteriota bacterium]|nr:hypothetical protein [Cyanobacteriota bacterium]
MIIALHGNAEVANIVGSLEKVASLKKIRGFILLLFARASWQPCSPVSGAGLMIINIAADAVENSLRCAQISSCHDHKDAIRRRLEHMHFAVGRYVIDPGIGSGIRGKNQSRF